MRSSTPKETILNSTTYPDALLSDIQNASETIDLETYIYEDDSFGGEVADALIQAAARGVKIRLLLDGAGTAWSDHIKRMEDAQIAVRIFHPVPMRLWQWERTNLKMSFIAKIRHLFLRINSRNHRKSAVFDKKIAYVGSINIMLKELSTEKGGENWLDAAVRITDADLTDLQKAFEIAWNGRIWLGITFRKKNLDPYFRLNYKRSIRRALYRNFLDRIEKSKNRVWLASAYFNPDFFLMRKLIRAARRNIDVKILLPSESDVIFMPWVANTFYSYLLKNNVKIYEYLPSVLHEKILIVDDWICVGTSNLNLRSLLHDLEVEVNIRTDDAKKIVEKDFLESIKKSREITTDNLPKLSWYKKLIAQIILIVRYFF